MSDTLQCSVLDDALRMLLSGTELGSLLPVVVSSPLHGTEAAMYSPAAGGGWQAQLPCHGMRLDVRIHPHPRGVGLDLSLTLTESLLLTAVRTEIAFPAALHLLQTGAVRIPLDIPPEEDVVWYATTHEVFPLRFSAYAAGGDDRLLSLDRTCPYHTVSVRLHRYRDGTGCPMVRIDRIGDEYGYPLLDAGTYPLFYGTLCRMPRQRPLFHYPRDLFSSGQVRQCLLVGTASTERLAWTAANLVARLPLVVRDGKVAPPRLCYLRGAGDRAEDVPAPLVAVAQDDGSLSALTRAVRRHAGELLVLMTDNVSRPLNCREKIAYWLAADRCQVVKYDRAGNAVFLVRGRGRILYDRLRAGGIRAARQCWLLLVTVLAVAGAPLVVPLLLLRAAWPAAGGRRA